MDDRCRDCGACCVGLPEMYVVLTDADRAREPKLAGLTRLADGEPCRFLAGRLCLVYETRPDACRGFEIGGYQCREARLAVLGDGR